MNTEVIQAPNTIPAQHRQEWLYVYQERLGLLVGAEEPSPELRALAAEEATTHVGQLS